LFFIFTQYKSEYWTRELKAEVIFASENLLKSIGETIELGYLPIVELTDYNGEFDSFPPNSLIALLYADENYDSNLNSSVLNSSVFKAIIRQYKVSSISQYEILKAILVGLVESSKILSFKTPRKLAVWFIEGIGMTKRQAKIREEIENSGKIIINVPLGYTDFFAETFLENLESSGKYLVSKSESLIEIAIHGDLMLRRKDYKFVFIGQAGQIVRQYAIKALQKFDSKRLIVRNNYSGVGNDENRKLRIGHEYVSGLLESQVSVCPPGNISGNSFRIMESLLCGAYPAVMSNVLCDPQFKSPVIEVLRGRKPHTWYHYLKKLEKVPEAELQQKVVENLYKFREEIKVAKLEIEALQVRD
jgi:hypothetical protein